MTRDWKPIKVAVLDLHDLPGGISEDERYGAVWALIREHGRPRGMVKIPLERGAASERRLRAAVAELPEARSCPPPSLPADQELPLVSVVVCTVLERRQDLDQTLASIARLEYPNYEVIVVDNRATERFEREGVMVVTEPVRCLSHARNRGVEAARGEIIAFTDDDVVVDPKWLTAIVARVLAHPDEVAVTGLSIPSELETPAQVALENYYGGFGPRLFEPVSNRLRGDWGRAGLFSVPLLDAVGDDGRVRRSFTLYAAGTLGGGVNMAFRTDVLRQVGGFDIRIGPGTPTQSGEDLWMFMQLAQRGYALGFEPASLVHHTHRRDEEGLRRQIFSYGVGWASLMAASVAGDPRHLGRMLATLPRGARLFVAGIRERGRGAHQTDLPGSADLDPRDEALIAELRRLELKGKLLGAFLYLRGRLRSSN